MTILNESFDALTKGASKSTEIVEKSYGWAEPFVFKLAASIVILLLGFAIGRFVGRVIERILDEIEINSLIKKSTKKEFNFSKTISNITSIIIYFFAIVFALETLGLGSLVLYIILIFISLLILLSLLFGLKDLFPNLFAGIAIKKNKLFSEGNHISGENFDGKVIEINFLETKIKNSQNEIIVIPNVFLIKNKIKIKNFPKKK